MAKADPPTPAALSVAQIVPQAATGGRGDHSRTAKSVPPKGEQVPLQLRLPRSEVRAIKIAAAEREQSISEFMLACFHAVMQATAHGAEK